MRFATNGENASPDISSIMHNVSHLLADEDIRSKSEEYKNMQLSEARKLIAALRSGRSTEAILLIGFF